MHVTNTFKNILGTYLENKQNLSFSLSLSLALSIMYACMYVCERACVRVCVLAIPETFNPEGKSFVTRH